MVLLLQRQLISAACPQQTSHRRIAQALASTGCFHPVLGLLDDLAERVFAVQKPPDGHREEVDVILFAGDLTSGHPAISVTQPSDGMTLPLTDSRFALPTMLLRHACFFASAASSA
jgi:hypothetical protein